MNSFPAKILLLGEYTILNGSKALAIPYADFSGRWSFERDDSDARKSSRNSLVDFCLNHGQGAIDQAAFSCDLENGIWFDSSIPQGYGLGSSGAVVAAIYDRYGKKDENFSQIKATLGKLEGHFHGASSGLDPMVSHIQAPLLIHSFNEVEVVQKSLSLDGFFLLNTGKPRQTGPLVKIFQEKLKDPQFKQGCAEILAREVNFAIDAILKGETTNLHHHLWLISKFQWDFFPEMIPTSLRGVWTRGLETGDYVLKLCGAGGGGFVLGYSGKHSLDEMRETISTHELRSLK